MDLERQKENFKKHVAKLTDYGNIKILDFKNPDTLTYRIRFLFEEDCYRLHISGDLGELIATNYSNMTYERFSDFVDDTDYFEQKIDCHSRAIYVWDEDKARNDIIEHMKKYGFYEDIVIERYNFETEEDKVDEFLDSVLRDFNSESGIGSKGYDVLSDVDRDIFEVYENFGKKETGILDLYMLAFKLAKEQIENQAK